MYVVHGFPDSHSGLWACAGTCALWPLKLFCTKLGFVLFCFKCVVLRGSMFFLGEYLEKIIPLVVKFCNVDDDELREYCIQAFESFVRR